MRRFKFTARVFSNYIFDEYDVEGIVIAENLAAAGAKISAAYEYKDDSKDPKYRKYNSEIVQIEIEDMADEIPELFETYSNYDQMLQANNDLEK